MSAGPAHAAAVARPQVQARAAPEASPSGRVEEAPQAESAAGAALPAFLQRKCATCGGDDELTKPPATLPRFVQRAQQAGPSSSAAPAAATPLHIAGGGVSGASDPLPHLGRIQAAFGPHDVSGVRTRTGGAAAGANEALGARAFTLGPAIGFRGPPDLHLAAHEAAHTVQQRAGVQLAGGMGREGDVYERHADAVADAVVAGRSAVPLLNQVAPSKPRDGMPAPAGPQLACACGSCPSCAAKAAQPREQLQFDLDPMAERQFSPALGGAAARGARAGGAARAAAAGGAAGGAAGAVAPAPGAAAAAGAAGGAASGAGPVSAGAAVTSGATGGAAAGAAPADPVALAARVVGDAACPPIPDRAPPEAGEPAPAPEACYESASVDTRSPERIRADEEAQRNGAPPPGEPPGVAMEAKGQVQPPPAAPPAPTPPPPPPPTPAACVEPEATPAPPVPPAAAPAPPAAPRLESPFDPQREADILQAQMRRSQRVTELDEAGARADGAALRLAQQGVSSVRFAAPGPEPGAAEASAAAEDMASQSIARGVGRARELFDQLRSDVPLRVTAALIDAKAAVEAARWREASAVAGAFQAARQSARADAGAALRQIDLQYGLTVLSALMSTLSTVGSIARAKTTGMADANAEKTTSLGLLDTAISDGQTTLTQAGTDRGKDAMAKGRSKHGLYKSARINRRDSWYDGHLTDRRADARAEAALNTAGGFRDGFAQEAANQAFQLGRSKPTKCARIVAAAFATGHAIDTQGTTFLGMARDGLAPQLAAAADTRQQLRSAVQDALANQLLSLNNKQQVQIQAIDDTAFLQTLALDEEAHGAAARLLQAGADGSEQVTSTYAAMRRLLEGRPAVPPAVLAQALKLADGAVAAALLRMREQLGGGLDAVDATLRDRVTGGEQALARIATGAAKGAGEAATAFGGSMEQIGEQAVDVFDQVREGYSDQLDALATAADGAFACALAQLAANNAAAVQEVGEGVATQRDQMDQSFQDQLDTVDAEIMRNACEAAKKEQPAWKEVVKVLLIIVIIIVAIVLTGPLAAFLAGGAAAVGLGSMIVAGAIIGALSAAAIQVVSNWASGQDLSKGVLRAAVTGAIAGAFGGAFGGFAGGASSLGGAIVRQVAVDFAGNMVSQLATGLIFDHRLEMPEYSLKDFAISVFMAALFVRRNVPGQHGATESYIGGDRTGAAGLRGTAWRGLARAQGFAHGVAGSLSEGGALRRGRAGGTAEPVGPVRSEQVSTEPGAPGARGPRGEPAGGPVAEGAPSTTPEPPTPRAPEPAARPAAEPGARPAAETAGAPRAEPSTRAAGAEPAPEGPLGSRPEAVTEVGVGDHKVYARRGPEGTEIGMCSGVCGPLKGKIDEMLPHASEELRGRLAEVRERATQLEGQVDRGEVARGPELEARIEALTAELRGIAGEHPTLRTLMDGPPPAAVTPAAPEGGALRLPSGPNAAADVQLPTATVPAEPVPSANPGTHETNVRNSLPDAQRVGFDRWMNEIRSRAGGDPEAVLGRMTPERARAVAENYTSKHATEVARGQAAEHVRARATDNPLDPTLRHTETHGDVTVRYETRPPAAPEIAHAQQVAAATGEPVHLFGDTASGVSYPGIDGTIGVPPRPMQLKTGSPDANPGWARYAAQQAHDAALANGYSHVEVEIAMPGRTRAEVQAAWDAPPTRPTDHPLGPVYGGDVLARVTVRCSDGVFTPPREVAPPAGGGTGHGPGGPGGGPAGTPRAGAAEGAAGARPTTVFEPFVGPSLRSPTELMGRAPGSEVIASEASFPPPAHEIAGFQEQGGRFINDRFGESLPPQSVDAMRVRFPLPHGKGMEMMIDLPAAMRANPGRSIPEIIAARQAGIESVTNLAPHALQALRPAGTLEVVYWEGSVTHELVDAGKLRWTDPATGTVYRLEMVGPPARVPRAEVAPHSGFGIPASETTVHMATLRKVPVAPEVPPGGTGRGGPGGPGGEGPGGGGAGPRRTTAHAGGVGDDFHVTVRPESPPAEVVHARGGARRAAPARETPAARAEDALPDAPRASERSDLGEHIHDITEGTAGLGHEPIERGSLADPSDAVQPLDTAGRGEVAGMPSPQRPRPGIGAPESVEAARQAGVPDEVLHSGTVLTGRDFADVVPETGLPNARPAPELPPRTTELTRGVAGRRPTTDPNPRDVQHTELQGDIDLITRQIKQAGGEVTEVAINRRQRAGEGGDAAETASTRTRPDVQIAVVDAQLNGRRITIEYDRAPGTRALDHAREILTRDPDAIVIIKIIGFE